MRVIVVTGSGRGFCAGAESEDLAGHVERGAYRSWDADDLARPGYGVRPEFDAELAYHFGIPKPIIAAVNGPAAGIGFALACYCDLRFAAAGAKLTTAHGKLGLPCAFGLAWLLPKLIGLPRALDLILSSRTFTAEEALGLGLVNAVVPADQLDDHVGAYARILATAVSPASMAASKRQVYEAFHTSAAEAVRTAEALHRPHDGRARLPGGCGCSPREAGGRLRGPPRWRAPQPALTRRGEHRPGSALGGPPRSTRRGPLGRPGRQTGWAPYPSIRPPDRGGSLETGVGRPGPVGREVSSLGGRADR